METRYFDEVKIGDKILLDLTIYKVDNPFRFFEIEKINEEFLTVSVKGMNVDIEPNIDGQLYLVNPLV